MARRLTFFILFILFSCTSLFAERPKVGLVLAGGGALGFAHIGVIKVLEENGIDVDCIAGTSMGGIVGALSAYGYSGVEIESIVSSVNWAELFIDGTNRDFMSYSDKTAAAKYALSFGFDRRGLKMQDGFVSGQKIENLFNKLVGPCSSSADFDALSIPFRAVSADILTGEQYVIKSGSLAEAMRCTMSIPGIFTPVDKEGHLLVDGMVVNNLPVDVARDMGADVIIAVNLSNGDIKREELRTPVGVADQMLNLYIAEIVGRQLVDADVVIDPYLEGYSSMSYFKVSEIIKAGEDAANRMLPKILEVAGRGGVKSFNVHRQHLLKIRHRPVTIDRIEVSDFNFYERNVMLKKLSEFIDSPFDVDRMNEIAADFHSSGRYESIRYYVDREGDDNVLKVNVNPVKSGPHYLRMGIFAEADANVHEDPVFNVLLGLEFNDLIFEDDMFNTELELFSGISADVFYFVPFYSFLFLEPRLSVSYQSDRCEYLDFERYGMSDLLKTEASMEVGTFIRSLGRISAGFMDEYFQYDYSSRFPYDDAGFVVNSLFFHSRMDNINSVVLPEHGTFLELMAKYSSEMLGSDDTYIKIKFTFWQYFQFLMKSSLGFKLFAGMDFATDIPYYDRSFLSYVDAFPGYSNSEFSSRNVVGAVADYKFNIFNLKLGGGGKFFLTFRGAVAAAYDDFDLFTRGGRDLVYGCGAGFGINLPRCPIVLEAAMNDSRRMTVHISAGNKF